jgi:ligand-binding SRPBCC domain-containing protein
MAIIYLETQINAPIERVFDLARSIDLHKLSAKQTDEKAIAGRLTGLLDLNETVTWRAKHFGIYQTLSVVLTKLERPHIFVDEMLTGAFSSMKHSHKFVQTDTGTNMIDIFEFTAPLGFLGKLAESLFLTNYMTKFLIIRNRELKEIAEGDRWGELLGG